MEECVRAAESSGVGCRAASPGRSVGRQRAAEDRERERGRVAGAGGTGAVALCKPPAPPVPPPTARRRAASPVNTDTRTPHLATYKRWPPCCPARGTWRAPRHRSTILPTPIPDHAADGGREGTFATRPASFESVRASVPPRHGALGDNFLSQRRPARAAGVGTVAMSLPAKKATTRRPH